MTAEMQIRLIDDNPEAQEAFKNAVTPEAQGYFDSGDVTAAIEKLSTDVTDFAGTNDANLTDAITTIQGLTDAIDALAEGRAVVPPVVAPPVQPPKPPGDEPPAKPEPESKLPAAIRGLSDRLTGSLRSLTNRVVAKLTQYQAGRAVIAAGKRVGGVAQATARRVADSRLGQAVGSGLSRVGGRAVAAGAGATVGGAAGGATAAGAGLAAALGPVAAAAVAVAAAFAGAVLAVKTFTTIANKVGDEIESFSPDVAVQRARADLAREFQRLDRAQRVGGGVAGIERAQAGVDRAIYELQTQALQVLVKLEPVIVEILERTEQGVDLAAGILEATSGKSLAELAAIAGNPGSGIGQIVGEAIGEYLREQKNQDTGPGAVDPLGPIFRKVMEAELDDPAPPPPGGLPLH